MKFRNDSKKSRWDLASDGFWSKKSIRELLSLLLLRHGRVCGGGSVISAEAFKEIKEAMSALVAVRCRLIA